MHRATVLWGSVLLALGGCASAPLGQEVAPTYVGTETSGKRDARAPEANPGDGGGGDGLRLNPVETASRVPGATPAQPTMRKNVL